MSIGEVSARTGIPTSTLRYYEEVGVLPAPRRVNGQRRYTPETLRLLAVILVAKQADFSLSEIRELLSPDGAVSDRWHALAHQKIAEADAMITRATQIKQIVRAGMDCSCTGIESCDLITM